MRGAARSVLLAAAISLPLSWACAGELTDLSGTGWQLAEIASMNDTVATPEAGSNHRLLFGIDGAVTLVADCYRATGALTRWDPPRVRFSAFAGTDPTCEASLLAERLRMELSYVRSFVYRDGHLYLATMADGSILDYAPLPAAEATATVAALSLVTDDPDALRSIALTTLLDAYASAAGIAVNEDEVDAYLDAMEERLRNDLGSDYEDPSSLADDERAEIERMRRAMATSFMRQWKVNKALYEDYGGRVIYQQLGPEPLDAYRELLLDAREKGQLSIRDPALADAFWGYFDDEKRHVFMPPGSEDEARAFTTPPWVH